LLVVQADATEFLNGLALADLRPVLAQERTVVMVGPGAGERLLEEMRSRLAGRLSGAYIPVSPNRVSPPVPSILERAETEQLSEHERLVGEVGRLYAGRDAAWWRARLSDGAPLRVLVPSCRYTTFVKHASGDLVEALERMGHTAELLIETDDSFRFSTLAYLRAIARLQPDVMILTNYMRQHIGEWVPATLPVVCWIQDAMPHQFDAAVGAKQGRYDFIVGHIWPELTQQFGFPKGRKLAMPVVASPAKFRPEPSDPELLRRYACEMAMATHQSEPPERMHERLITEAGRGTPIQRVFEELRPLVFELGRAPHSRYVFSTIDDAALEALRTHLGVEPNPKALTMVRMNYCRALADRVLRHQTLQWAAELAEERGWRLAIYGRGWDSHPTLARYARPELPHGEHLRAAYQAAAVHLHASINTVIHQRVMECALSGGVPLCRPTFEMFRQIHMHALRTVAGREAPTVCDPVTREHGHFIADHPEAAAYIALTQRLGRPSDAFFWVADKFRGSRQAPMTVLPLEESNTAAWLLGDLGELTFESKRRLGELVERAKDSPPWRAGWSASIASRVRDRYTHDILARRVLGLVRESFEPDGA
jgi:hypothetical protein